MVGRKVILKIEKGPAHPGAVALEARNLVVRDDRGVPRIDGVSFLLREGEILGVAGVRRQRASRSFLRRSPASARSVQARSSSKVS